MSTPVEALGQRLREIRRRHFGPGGKAAFAERLGLALDEYTRFERGVLPPGDLMVRICEVTGEDLQWLLTGVASRGTVVIAGARSRHRDVLARLAELLDTKPQLAAPVEAFLDLLTGGEQAQTRPRATLPEPRTDDLIPIFDARELPSALPDGGSVRPGGLPLLPSQDSRWISAPTPATLAEPAMQYDPAADRAVQLVIIEEPRGPGRPCLADAEISRCFPGAFGVRLGDDSMKPMFCAGDAVILAAGTGPRVGRPAICRVADESAVRCRIWLGDDGEVAHLGRLDDGEIERVGLQEVLWSLEALFRLAPAA